MSTPEELFSESIDANRQLKEVVEAKVGEYDQKVSELDTLAHTRLDEQQNQLNQWEQEKGASLENEVKASAKTLLTPITAYYDGLTHSKESMAIEADPTDATLSLWKPVPDSSMSYHFYPTPGKLLIVNQRYAHSLNPGYYENPQYDTDHSRTYMQFVYANDSATSEEINELLTDANIVLPLSGFGSDRVSSYNSTAVKVADKHPYSRLFVRFVNRPARPGDEPQEITQFGGNSSFSIDSVRHYQEIDFQGF